ncbi:MAG: SulP family inorganic anion transporter [Anaerolineae bacterium]
MRTSARCDGGAYPLLTGAFMLAAGLLKLGFLARFISNAVLRGFITGIGVNVILGQLGDFTGYSSEFQNKVVKPSIPHSPE